MGNPAFYLYPEASGPLKVVDFGQSISDCYLVPTRRRTDAVGGDGVARSLLGPGGAKVTIRRERSALRSTERAWRNVEDHLIRGGRVGFSWDHSKTWAGFLNAYPTQGNTLLYTDGNAFTSWSSSAALASGDELVIESPNPELKREVTTFSSINSANQITIGSALWYTYAAGAMVRWRSFWPALYLAQDQLNKSIVTSDHGINYTLQVELTVDPAIYAPASAGGLDINILAGPTDPIGHARMSLEDMLGRGGSSGSVVSSRSGAAMFDKLYGSR